MSETVHKNGSVYTREWVTQFMLDLAGYRPTVDLGASTIVEPGCGDGEFLVEIVRRLLESAHAHGRIPEELEGAIRGFDLDGEAVQKARQRVQSELEQHGIGAEHATKLATVWVVEGDFLLWDHASLEARWVVGNPPYIRVEDLDAEQYAKYRACWPTMSGRADVYVGFFEAGLSLLTKDGVLSFICADRWMHNQYGAGLRRKVIENFAMDLVIELHDVDVFASQVAAYPAITLIRNGLHQRTALVTADSSFDATSSGKVRTWLLASEEEPMSSTGFSADWLNGSFSADDSWPSGPPERLALIADLESRLPALSATEVEIGVGLATGADKVFVVHDLPHVEADRIQPAIGPSDLKDGSISWQGRSIISPWKNGELVALGDYPKLAAYFEANADALKARYVAKQNTDAWWRTIDKPRLAEYANPKLIVADINDRIEPVLDINGYWPLHSAYFITSSAWDLEALGGYLMSDTAAAFVEAYSVKMAGGHLRVSAQYLRKIRAPKYSDIGKSHRKLLVSSFRARDRAAASRVVNEIVSLS